MDLEQLCTADVYSCGVKVALSRIRQSNSRLGVFAARTCTKGAVPIPYYGTIDCHGSPSRLRTQEVHEDGVSKVDLARLPKYALQLRIQSRRFEKTTELLPDREAVCYYPHSFCLCVLTNELRYAKKYKGHELPQKKLLRSARSPSMTFQQKTTTSEDYLVDLYCMFL